MLSKEHMLKTTRKANKIAKKEDPNYYEAQQLLSHLGWFRHANVYNVFKDYIKPTVDVKQLKRKVSDHARKENRKNENELENCKGMQGAGQAGDGKDDGISAPEH